jgi:hypothetical protein
MLNSEQVNLEWIKFALSVLNWDSPYQKNNINLPPKKKKSSSINGQSEMRRYEINEDPTHIRVFPTQFAFAVLNEISNVGNIGNYNNAYKFTNKFYTSDVRLSEIKYIIIFLKFMVFLIIVSGILSYPSVIQCIGLSWLLPIWIH